MRILVVILLLCGAFGSSAMAQAPATTQTAVDDFRVSIITLGPGSDPWERFGHNMLRIQNRVTGEDVSFNWGLFDFDSGFILKFIQGRLLYSMGPFKSVETIDLYARELDRDIWEQELNLSPSQKKSLWDFCWWNYQRENRDYKYDYYWDNCSTRVRDALDLVLVGKLKEKLSAQQSPYTFRSETNRLMSSDVILYTALGYILGQPIDRPISVWDELFIPMRLRERLNQFTILDESGREIPIVKSEVKLNTSKREPPRETPPNWVMWYLLMGSAIGGALANGAARVVRGSTKRPARWGFIALAMFWSLLAGFGGWFMLYAWTTNHTAVRDNENIMQFSPLLLPLVVLIPKALARRGNAGKIAFRLAQGALALSILGLVLKVLPGMYQVNANLIALALPANAGLAAAMWKLQQLSPTPALAPAKKNSK